MSRRICRQGAALAALAVISSTSADALEPNAPLAALVYVGGSFTEAVPILPASDPFELLVRTICQNNLIDPFNPVASGAIRTDIYRGTDNLLITCLSNASLPGVSVGTRIGVFRSSVGGVATGTIPVARQVTTYGTPPVNVRFLTTPVSFPNGGNCSVAAAPANVVGALIAGGAVAAQYLNHTGCGSGSVAIVPQVGISDRDPLEVIGATPSDVHSLSASSIPYHLMYGYAVSEPLRNALQAAQGLVSCAVSRGDASREAMVNQPSLTRDQIGSIVTGNITNWNQITVRGSSLGLYDFVNAIPAGSRPGCLLPPTAPSGEGGARTFVFRHLPTSTTQAVAEMWTLRQRCTLGTPEYVQDLDPAGSGSTTVPSFDSDNWVQEYATSEGVRFALDKASGPWSLQAGAPASARWAIAPLSCEDVWSNPLTGNRAHRFVKIHGAAPGLKDTANSAYDNYAEWHSFVNTSKSVPPPAGLPDSLASYLLSNLSPLGIRLVNAGICQPGSNHPQCGSVSGDWVQNQGQGCRLAMPDGVVFSPPQPISATSIEASPINTSWKRPLGFTNNCAYPSVPGFFDSRTPSGGFNENTNPQ